MVVPDSVRVGVIGAGRVGTALGEALIAAGHQVVATTAISAASRQRARDRLPGATILPADEVAAAAELIVLSVPDDTLTGLVRGLARTGIWGPQHTVIHTSGRHGLKALEAARRAGARCIALHPAMTFTGHPVDVDRLEEATFTVTCTDEDLPYTEQLVDSLGGTLSRLEEAQRPLYHAALVLGSNHLATVLADAADLLRDSGIERPQDVLRPLVEAAVENTLRDGDEAATGPVSRGDTRTVRAHLEVLERERPHLLELYRAGAMRAVERMQMSGRLKAPSAAALRNVLRRVVETEQGGLR